MPTRAELASAALALAVHVAAGYAVLRVPVGPPPKSPPIEVDIRPPRVAPVAARVAAPEPAAAPSPIEPVKPRFRERAVAAAPPVRDPPSRGQESPPPPVFGFAMESTTAAESSVSIPVGNTTAIDPGRSAPHDRPLPSGTARRLEGPPDDLSIRTMPDVDVDACGRSVTYPKEAEALGIEGAVKLRVSLDERGNVVEAKVLSGPGHGLDQAALEAILHRCKFTPAIASDGRPVAYVVDPYVFHFEIPR